MACSRPPRHQAAIHGQDSARSRLRVEQKALFRHPEIACALDEHSFLCLLLYERFDGAMTPYRGVEAFLPGTISRFRDGSESSTAYFDVLRDIATERIAEHDNEDFDSQLDRFERHFRNSVEMHLISDAPVATMCSGGLDSGLVTAVASKVSPRLVSYVADIEGMNGQELERARAVTASLGVELRRVPVIATRISGRCPKPSSPTTNHYSFPSTWLAWRWPKPCVRMASKSS